MDGGCSASEQSNAPASSGLGASEFLANLPSRGNFSSTVLSSNLGGARVYICNRDTSAPENQIIRTNQTNILIRSLMLMKQKGESGSKAANHGSRKRAAEKALDGKAAGKRAMTSTQLGSSQDFQSLTVERLRALLREKGLPVTGRKDELIARLRGANS